MSERVKFAVAAGGTAGHVVPALAVADVLRDGGNDVVFFGGERAEIELVPAAGYAFHGLKLRGLDRRNPVRAVAALILALRGIVRARKLLKQERVAAVLAGGGYVAGPVGLAAVTLGIPLVSSEADAHLGVTNRLLAPFAKRVCLAFELPGRTAPKYLVTGRPIAPRRSEVGKSEARKHFGLPDDGFCLLAFGGSLGARTINRAAADAFSAKLPDDLSVLHLTGRGGYDETLAALGSIATTERYRLLDYTDDFDLALTAADLAVCRAGGSIFELAAAGLPAVLVPYPYATADHQTVNARWLVDGGAAVLVPDGELTGDRLRAVVAELLENRDRLTAMAAAAQALAKPRAAEAIAGELLAVVDLGSPA